jgi:hypothetical protein
MAVCPDNTIDSNVTGLAVAEEICPGQLPTIEDDGFLPTWYEQEPNSYPDTFGGSLKTTARAPIKANRQRSKGTTIDLDASAGWNSDYTQNNMARLLQGFMFADVREKPTTAPMNSDPLTVTSAVNSTGVFAVANAVGIYVGQLVEVEGSVSNEGVYTVSAVGPAGITVVESINDETFPDGVIIRVVGEHYAAGGLSLTVSGSIGTLHNAGTAPVAGTSQFTASAQPADGDHVVIGDISYTFKTATPAAAYEVLIGASATTAGQNLTSTINGLSTLSPAHPDVTASNTGAGVVLVTAKIKGTLDASIVTTEDGTNTAWNHAALTGGAGHSLLATRLIGGEWFFLGGDAAGHHFANNVGYARVGSINDVDLVMDRTTWDVQAEAAGTLTIDIFLGSLTQNENDPDLVKKRTYQAQRTLGHDADGTQSQYIPGCVANEFTLNIPVTAPLTVDLSFLAMSEEFRTGAVGLKAGTLVPALDESSINTANDIYEMAMTIVTPGNSNPTKLFGYLSEAKLVINNNVSTIKGIGKLGGIGVNVGIFEVSGTATAYFQRVAANVAITNNDDVDQHFIIAKLHAGAVFDIGLLTLGGGNIKIESNKPIEIPLNTDAAQNSHGSTLSITNFPYLPTLAMPDDT